MIEFNQLEHLVAIAKNKTISKAAEELLISQPGLTKSMQRLEEDLGLSLFNRKKNKIELNDNGLLAVEFAKKLLDGREEMIKELTKHNQNYLLLPVVHLLLYGELNILFKQIQIHNLKVILFKMSKHSLIV